MELRFIVTLGTVLGVVAMAALSPKMELMKDTTMEVDRDELPIHEDHGFVFHAEILEALRAKEEGFTSRTIQHLKSGTEDDVFLNLAPLHGEIDTLPFDTRTDGLFHSGSEYFVLDDYDQTAVHEITDDRMLLCDRSGVSFSTIKKSDYILGTGEGEYMKSDDVAKWLSTSEGHVGPRVRRLLKEDKREIAGFTIVRKVLGVTPYNDKCIAVNTKTVHPTATLAKFTVDSLFHKGLAAEVAHYHEQIGVDAFELQRRNRDGRRYLEELRAYEKETEMYPEGSYRRKLLCVVNCKKKPSAPPYLDIRNYGVRNCDDSYVKWMEWKKEYFKYKYSPWNYNEWALKDMKKGSYMWFMGTAGGCVQANKRVEKFNFNFDEKTGGADQKNFVMSGVANNGVSCTNCYVQLGDYVKVTISWTTVSTVKLLAYLGGATKRNMDVDLTNARTEINHSGTIVAASDSYSTVQVGYFKFSWASGELGYELTGRSDALGSMRGHHSIVANLYTCPWYGGWTEHGTGWALRVDQVSEYSRNRPRLIYNQYVPTHVGVTASLSATEKVKFGFGASLGDLGKYSLDLDFEVTLRTEFKFGYDKKTARRLTPSLAHVPDSEYSFSRTSALNQNFEESATYEEETMDIDAELEGSIYGSDGSEEAYADLDVYLEEDSHGEETAIDSSLYASHLTHRVSTSGSREDHSSGREQYNPGDTLGIRYAFAGMPPHTRGRLFFALETATGDRVGIGQHDYKASESGSGMVDFSYVLPWHQLMADPDGTHLFRVFATNSENTDISAVSEPFSFQAFSGTDTIFTPEGTSALTSHGGILYPETFFEVTWASHLLHHFHQEAYETWHGVHREAENVRFELRGELLGADGEVVSTTEHQILTGGLDGVPRTFPNTGRATLSFPHELTSTLSGHRFYLVVQDSENTAVQGWSSGYFKFHPGLTQNGLPLVQADRLVDAAFDESHARMDNKVDDMREGLARRNMATDGSDEESPDGRNVERELYRDCLGATLHEKSYINAPGRNAKVDFKVYWQKIHESRMTTRTTISSTFTSLCVPKIPTPGLCPKGTYSITGRAPCGTCGEGMRPDRPLGALKCQANGPTGKSVHVDRPKCYMGDTAATNYDGCVNRYQTTKHYPIKPGGDYYEECTYCVWKEYVMCFTESAAKYFIWKYGASAYKCGKPTPPPPPPTDCPAGTWSSTGKTPCGKCASDRRSEKPTGSSRCVKNGPNGDSTLVTNCDKTGTGTTPTFGNCAYHYMAVKAEDGSMMYEDCKFCTIEGNPKCITNNLVAAYKDKATCLDKPPAPPPGDCTAGNYSSTGKAPCTACGVGERSEKPLGSQRCVSSGGRTQIEQCSDSHKNLASCSKYYSAVGSEFVDCQFCKYSAWGQYVADSSCLSPSQVGAFPSGSIQCGKDITYDDDDASPTLAPTGAYVPTGTASPTGSGGGSGTTWGSSCELYSATLNGCQSRHTTRWGGSKTQCHFCSWGGHSLCIDGTRMDKLKKSKDDMVCGVEYCQTGTYSSTGQAPCTACGTNERSEKVLGSTRCVSSDSGVTKGKTYTASCALWRNSYANCNSYYSTSKGQFVACEYCSHYGSGYCRDTEANKRYTSKYPGTYKCGVEYCQTGTYSSTGQAPCTACGTNERSEKVEASTKCVPNSSGELKGRSFATSCHTYKSNYADCSAHYTARDGNFVACEFCSLYGSTWCMDSSRVAKYKKNGSNQLVCGIDYCQTGTYSSTGQAPCTACGTNERSEKVLGSTRCVSSDSGVSKGKTFVTKCGSHQSEHGCSGAYTIYRDEYQACNFCTYRFRTSERAYCLSMGRSSQMTKYYPDPKQFTCVSKVSGGSGSSSDSSDDDVNVPTDDDSDDQPINGPGLGYPSEDDDRPRGGSGTGLPVDDDSNSLPDADDALPSTVPGDTGGGADGGPKGNYSTPSPPTSSLTGWLVTKLYPSCNSTSTNDTIMHSVEAVGLCKYAGVRAKSDMYMISAFDEEKLALGMWYFSGQGAEMCTAAALNILPNGNPEFLVQYLELGTCIRPSFDSGLHASVTTYSADVSACPKADFGPGMGYAYYERADGCGAQESLTAYFVTNPRSCYQTPTRLYGSMSKSSTCAAGSNYTTVASYPDNIHCNASSPIIDREELVSCAASADSNNTALHEGYLVSSNTGRFYDTFCDSAPDVVAGNLNSNSESSASEGEGGNTVVVAGVLCSLLCVCCCCFLIVCIYRRRKQKEEEEVITEIIIEHAPAQPAQSECADPGMDPEYGAYAYTPNPLHSRRASLSSDQPPPPPPPPRAGALGTPPPPMDNPMHEPSECGGACEDGNASGSACNDALPRQPLRRPSAYAGPGAAPIGGPQMSRAPPGRRPSSMGPPSARRQGSFAFRGPPGSGTGMPMGRQPSSQGPSPSSPYRGRPSNSVARRPSERCSDGC